VHAFAANTVTKFVLALKKKYASPAFGHHAGECGARKTAADNNQVVTHEGSAKGTGH
jgi:hypothetical protein